MPVPLDSDARTNEEELPTIGVGKIENMGSYEHYLVAAYDSNEQFNQKVLVVIPELQEPTWILAQNARKAKRGNVIGLSVPSLDAFTLPLAQALTHMITNYIVVREWSETRRRAGNMQGGMRSGNPVIRMPWNS